MVAWRPEPGAAMSTTHTDVLSVQPEARPGVSVRVGIPSGSSAGCLHVNIFIQPPLLAIMGTIPSRIRAVSVATVVIAVCKGKTVLLWFRYCSESGSAGGSQTHSCLVYEYQAHGIQDYPDEFGFSYLIPSSFPHLREQQLLSSGKAFCPHLHWHEVCCFIC